MRAGAIAASKWTFIIAGGVVLAWILASETGRRLPYLHTVFAFRLRAFVVFPALLSSLAWRAFIQRSVETGMTGMQMALARMPDRKQRIRAGVLGVVGIIFIPAALAETSVYFPAHAADLLARQPFSHAYRVISIFPTPHTYTDRYDYRLMGIPDREEATLVLTSAEFRPLPLAEGDYVCAKGRTSVFGTIIETVRRTKHGECPT